MPLRKFEDLDSARLALWTSPNDPSLLRRIRNLWERSRRLAPPETGIPRGLRRFHSIEEANLDRYAWTRRRVQALRERRHRG